MSPFRIESLLAARLFLEPRLVGERLYFISDLSGRLSLYVMDVGGSVPEPLLPPDIALQNPHHLSGEPFAVLPELDKIIVLIDQDGDENYQPMSIPLNGGLPEPIFGDHLAGCQVTCSNVDVDRNLAVLTVDRRTTSIYDAYLANLATGELTPLGSSAYGNYGMAVSSEYDEIILADFYTAGDTVLYRWQQGDAARTPLLGKPLDQRGPDEAIPLSGFAASEFTTSGNLLLVTSLFQDTFGLGLADITASGTVFPVEIMGTVHAGVGELEQVEACGDDCYLLTYNIDGTSWAYAGRLEEAERRFVIEEVIVGRGELANGVLESLEYDRASGRYALSFSTATTPAQIYVVDGASVHAQTRERLLGIAPSSLAPGEDASYISHDGLRISARLYLPATQLSHTGPRPVIFYIHGGPQSQERPDFTWFSMPLIQFLTLNGFAVFVPNVRGSTGYGMAYMKEIDRDWGGADRLDHVMAFEHLRNDPRLDLDRAGVMGRSYGGYMTLTQVGRHPELWRAAVDMFGPYDLFTFLERIPETWKPYFHMALGHPEQDAAFLTERSPSTHLPNLACPLLVIQGANDPRVVELESADLVAQLQREGKDVDYLVFEDEGHDVLKYKNKVICYNAITDFFIRYLQP